MAKSNIQLKPPECFDFSQPDTWLKWKKRFEQFRVASGLNGEDESRQVSTLLYCLGEEADAVLTSTNIKEEDKTKYDAVLGKFDAFFQVRKNTIFERARFNRRNQNEGESAEQYITALYSLVETCDYGALKDEMLRDRIVVGIRNTALSEKMQTNADLTLEKAKTMVRQKEAVAEQSLQLRGDGSKKSPIVTEQVKGDSVSKPQPKRTARSYKPQSTQGIARSTTSRPQCTRCGRSKHQKGDS